MSRTGPSSGRLIDLSSGVVTDFLPDTPTIDVPATLESGVCEVALDGIELLHFAGTDGGASLERTRPSPVSLRKAAERFFMSAGVHDRNEHGWQICRLCARET